MGIIYYFLIAILVGITLLITFVVKTRLKIVDEDFISEFNFLLEKNKFFELVEFCRISNRINFGYIWYNSDLQMLIFLYSLFWIFSIPLTPVYFVLKYLNKYLWLGASLLVKYILGKIK
jgi:hypothetical protein